MARRRDKIDNFRKIAQGSGIPIGILIQIVQLYNSMSPDEQRTLIEQENIL